MPLYDYRCIICEAEQKDLYYTLADRPQRLKCPECGRWTCTQDFRGYRGIDRVNGSMYGKYHPGFGCVVESYEHKQELHRKYGTMDAADPEGGSRSRTPGEYTGNKAQDETKRTHPDTEWISRDIRDPADQEALNRAAEQLADTIRD